MTFWSWFCFVVYQVLQLDVSSQYHIEYITSAALLRAENFNIRSEDQCRSSKANFEATLAQVRDILAKLPPPPVFKVTANE